MSLQVTTYVCPYDKWHDPNQVYPQAALKLTAAATGSTFTRLSMSRFPTLLRPLRQCRDSHRLQKLIGNPKYLHRLLDRIAVAIAGPTKTPSGLFHNVVGQYLFKSKDGKECKVCIDGSDSCEISHQGLVDWSDIYFKINGSRARHYPEKILPMFNGDPRVLQEIARLRSFRTMQKRYDVCFIVRVWGGTNEIEGIEHSVRMLEALARAKCKTYLAPFLVAGDIRELGRRLASRGIPATTSPTPVGELWRIAAQSRLTVIRLGNHYCIPWGMTAALAMGGCLALDRPPYTVWPEPLLENTNFLSLDLDVGLGKPLASDDQYSAIPGKIERWLSDDERINRISRQNADYFDRFLAPEKVGGYIRETVARWLDTSVEFSGSPTSGINGPQGCSGLQNASETSRPAPSAEYPTPRSTILK